MLCKIKRKMLCRAQSIPGWRGWGAAHGQAGSGVPERQGRADCIRLLRSEIMAFLQRRKQISNHKTKLKIIQWLDRKTSPQWMLQEERQEMPGLPGMKFQERFQLEEGAHSPAVLQARELVHRLHMPAKQEVIQDLDTFPQNCSWRGFFGGLG